MGEFATGFQPLLWVSNWLVPVATEVHSCHSTFLHTFLPLDLQCLCVAQSTVEVVLQLVVRKVLEAKPSVFNRSNSIMFMFFWKECWCLPNHAELKIIMEHIDKNRKRDAGSSCRRTIGKHISHLYIVSPYRSLNWDTEVENVIRFNLWLKGGATLTHHCHLTVLLCCFWIPFTWKTPPWFCWLS